MKTKIYEYQGECAKCKQLIKISSVYPNDKTCCECMYEFNKPQYTKYSYMKIKRRRR